jgi:hypothetical protein
MTDKNNWAWFLLFGSLWGISEVAGGGILYGSAVPFSSVFLAGWAFFILAVARGVVNKPGSSTIIGAVATLFKLINVAPFICHLLGIFMLGAAFDVVASLLLKKERRISLWSPLTGIIAAYSGYALFAFVITYLVRYEIWVSGGFPKVMNHIFVSGSAAAAAAAVMVPLGFLVGIGSGVLADRRPRLIYTGTIAGVILLWILGRFMG